MSGVGQTGALVDRVTASGVRLAAAGRRLAADPGSPVGAAVLLGLLAMIENVLRGADSAAELSIVLLLGLLATMPLALARAHPILAAAAISTATSIMLFARYPLTFATLAAQLACLYVLGRRHPRLVPLVVLPFVAYPIAPGTQGTDRKLIAILLLTLFVATSWLGIASRRRREAADQDAAQRAFADSLSEHAARGERARIARELHDVVAHHISMISVQAETARLTTPGMPVEGAKRLSAIGDTARAALTEMRRLLGVLRDDAGAGPSRQPQPGLQHLVELIDEARDAAGATARLIVRGHVRPLDPGVELTAYRIVQEALTNARRHAPGSAVDVQLDYLDDTLAVRVRDNGPGPNPADWPVSPYSSISPSLPLLPVSTPDSSVSPDTANFPHSPVPFDFPDSAASPSSRDQVVIGGSGGHGLLGMRERAATVGGTLRVGPAPGCGFLVDAVLPIERTA